MKKTDYIAIIIIGLMSGLLLVPTLRNILPSAPSMIALVPTVILVAVTALWLTKILERWKPVFFQIGKFASVGVLNTLIDFGVLNFLSLSFQVFDGSLVALFNIIGFTLANINSYFWNKFWTFGSYKKKSTIEFARFFAISIIGISINTAIVYLMTTYVSTLGEFNASQWENVAKAVATLISLIWNFLGYKFIVFSSPTDS